MKILFVLVCCLTGWFAKDCAAQPGLPDLKQYKTTEEKLKALAKACDDLSNDDKDDIKKISRYALQLIKDSNYFYLSTFNYNIGYAYNDTAPDSAVIYQERALYYGRKSGKIQKITPPLIKLLYQYNTYKSDTIKRKSIFNEMEAIYDTISLQKAKGDLAEAMANYFEKDGEYEKAIEYLLYDLEITRERIRMRVSADPEKEGKSIGYLNIRIAELYLGQKQFEKSIEYLLQARYILTKDMYALSFIYKDLATAYTSLEQLPVAKLYYDSLTSLIEKTGNNDMWSLKLELDLTLGDSYLQKHQVDTALLYVNAAAALAVKWKMGPFQVALVDLMQGRILSAKKDYAKALEKLQAALPRLIEMDEKLHAEVLKDIAQCYAGLGQYEQASRYYEKYIPLRDSLSAEAAKQSIANAEARYKNKVKQQEIEIKTTQLSLANKQRLWLIGGLVLTGLLVLLLVLVYRNKKRTADALQEANQTKAKLFGIISHDLRSPISQVYQFLQLQQLNPGRLDEAQKEELSNKIQTATGSLLETMEDLLLWSKTQMDQFNTDIQASKLLPVIDQCEQLLQLNSQAKNITVLKHILPADTVDTDAAFLQTIVRNLLQNAIKASPQNGTITIDFSKNVLSISNQGTAFTQAQYEGIVKSNDSPKGLSGLGLKVVDELSKKIKATVRFENTPGNETVALIVF